MRRKIKRILSIGVKGAHLTAKQIAKEIEGLKIPDLKKSDVKKLADGVRKESKAEAKRIARFLLDELKKELKKARKAIKKTPKKRKAKKTKRKRRRR